jgi:hypothetical protein
MKGEFFASKSYYTTGLKQEDLDRLYIKTRWYDIILSNCNAVIRLTLLVDLFQSLLFDQQ